MKEYLKMTISISLAILILASCADEESNSTGPTENKPEIIEFQKEFSRDELPNNINPKSIRDGAWFSEKTYLLITVSDLIKIENGNAEKILGGVTGVSVSSDGNIYCIGGDPNVSNWEAIYYSTDGGESFEYISKPLLDEGVSLYRGYPSQIMVRKLNDGNYLMILKTEYSKSVVGYKLYEDYYFESTDGINWEYRNEKDATSEHFEPTAIDNEGNVFYEVKEKNEFNSTDLILYRSDDKGRSNKRVEGSKIPNGIDNNGKLWSIIRIESEYEDTRFFSWNGSEWVSYQGTGFDQLIAGPKVDFTDNNKIVIITSKSIYVEK